MSLLGLDVGSTACKAILFSDKGEQLSYSYREYPSAGNVSETNGDVIWACVSEVLTECASAAVSGDPVRAVSVSSFGESFVPIDRNGKVLMNTMLYTDKRGQDQCRRFEAEMGREIEMIAGAKLHPMYSLSKFAYIRDEIPGVFEETHKFLLIASFCIYRLTGEYFIDYSLAARTLAFDVVRKKWSDKLLALAGVTADMLPEPVPAGTGVAHILSSVAIELGLPSDLLVVTGGHDQVCACIGAGVTQAGTAVDGTGTVECITPLFDRPVLDVHFLENNFACIPYAIDGMYVTYAFNFTGGSILKWYRDNFAGYERELAREKGISVYKLLDERGAKEPTDLIVVPHFAGSATPDMVDHARGAFYGLRFDTTAPVLYRALIEGVTYEMAYNMRFLSEVGINIRQLRAVGGGANSDYWLQIKADITGCDIIPLDVPEAGITGTAMLAGIASGIYGGLEEAAGYFVKERPPILPDEGNHRIYMENIERYIEARKRSTDLYKSRGGEIK